MAEPCRTREVHPAKVNVARKKIQENSPLLLSEFFKLLSGETRIKILLALAETELCVCDLSEILEMTPSAVSHQLRELKLGRFVKSRRVGKEIYYSLEIEHLEPILNQALDHIGESG